MRRRFSEVLESFVIVSNIDIEIRKQVQRNLLAQHELEVLAESIRVVETSGQGVDFGG